LYKIGTDTEHKEHVNILTMNSDKIYVSMLFKATARSYTLSLHLKALKAFFNFSEVQDRY